MLSKKLWARGLVVSLALLCTACALIAGLKDRELATGDDGGTDSSPDDRPVDGKNDAPADAAHDGSSDVTTDTTNDTTNDTTTDAPPNDAGPDALDGSCDASLTSDPMNCGSCGHSCMGSTCTNSLCDPVFLGMSSNSVVAVTVDPNNVYWLAYNVGATGNVMEAPIDGGTAMFLAATASAAPVAIANYSNNVFWTLAGAMSPVREDLTTTSQTIVGTTTTATQMAIDGTYLYWGDNAPAGTVHFCTLPGCPTVSQTPAPSGGAGVTSVAAANGRLFFGVSAGTASEMYTCMPPNCMPIPMGIGGNVVNSIAADANNVYFTDDVTTVWMCPVSGCGGAPKPFASQENRPTTVAVDGTNLYWDNSGALRWCRLPTCSPVNYLVLKAPTGLAFDTKAVYFGLGPAVYKVAKP